MGHFGIPGFSDHGDDDGGGDGIDDSDNTGSRGRGGGDGGGGLTSGDVRDLIPDWVFNPRAKILGIVASWIVSGVVMFSREMLAIVLEAGQVLQDLPGIVGNALTAAFAAPADAVIGVIGTINSALVETASSLGPFGWVFLAIAFVGLLFGLLRFSAWVIESVDVPIVNLSPLLRGLFSPLTTLWRWLT